MRSIVIDTCILIHIARGTEIGQRCLSILQNLDAEPIILLSAVTKAELLSFIAQNKWGEKKINTLNEILDEVIYIDISNADDLLLEAYTQIDAFSKRKITDKSGKLLSGSARKMGKNDIWIAATAYTLDLPLLTADNDFDHLNGNLINVVKV